MNPELLELAPLLARRELWLFLSTAYSDPYHGERFALLRDPGFRQRALRAGALFAQEQADLELGPGEAQPSQLSVQCLFDALDEEWGRLEAAYRQLFGLTAVSTACPPCELEYEPNTDVTYRAQRLADIAGFYQAFGLQGSAHAGERLDHVTLQAEFLYVLLAKEAAARQEGNREGADICCEARRSFFEEHVGWWLPTFSHLLFRNAPSKYYQELAALTASLSTTERASLGLPPFHIRSASKPTPSGPAAECAGCLET